MELQWISSVPASALYAALALVRRRSLVDSDLAAALRPAVAALESELTLYGYPSETLLWQWIPLAASFDGDPELAKVALNKAVGRNHPACCAPVAAEAVVRLQAALLAARPRIAEELPLRMEPLRNQWEARGPGLLAGMRRLTGDDLLVPAASLVLVQPVLGGGGEPHPTYNRVTFEAVLANPIACLPEVLRLGWLLAQLNFDLPVYEDRLGRKRMEFVGPLALIPVVLAAAEDIELARCDAEHLRLALTTWLDRPDVFDTLAAWWETYRESRPSWIVGLAALGEMLGEGSRN